MKQTVILCILTLGLSSLSHAEEKGKANRPDFKSLDKNGDRAISEEEAGPQIWARLGKLDKNGDGKVAGAEFVRPGGGEGMSRPKGNPGEFMKRIDKNGDGNLSKDEAPEQLWARLSKLDKDGDNSISKEEFAAARNGGGSRDGNEEIFARIDKDNDGNITESEAPQFWEKLSKADKNSDGSVSKEEWLLARSYMDRMGKGGMKGRGKGGPQPGGPNAIFGKYDEDKDGKLSEAEVPAELWAKLSKADDNADGRVSQEELANVYSKMREMNAPNVPSVPKRPQMEDKEA